MRHRTSEFGGKEETKQPAMLPMTEEPFGILTRQTIGTLCLVSTWAYFTDNFVSGQSKPALWDASEEVEAGITNTNQPAPIIKLRLTNCLFK